MEFDGKVAVVTGATSGIGMATARRLAEQGAHVAAVGRNAQALANLEHKRIRTYRVDLADEKATDEFAVNVVRDLRGVDVLVNAAGILAMGTIENTTLADYDAMMNIN